MHTMLLAVAASGLLLLCLCQVPFALGGSLQLLHQQLCYNWTPNMTVHTLFICHLAI